jgi:hypothetical protein
MLHQPKVHKVQPHCLPNGGGNPAELAAKRSKTHALAASCRCRCCIWTRCPAPAAFSQIAPSCFDLCVELNKLFGTQWPVRSVQQLRAHLHLCGPSMQTDTWSCGYRLLCGWTALLAVMRQTHSISPNLVSRACNDVEQQTSLSQMVEQTRALYDDAAS